MSALTWQDAPVRKDAAEYSLKEKTAMFEQAAGGRRTSGSGDLLTQHPSHCICAGMQDLSKDTNYPQLTF